MIELRRKFTPSKDRLQVLSSGGGTQSNCMIVLAAQGLIPKPDLIVMADTEYEASNVFEYQRQYIQPICDSMGVEYIIIKKSDWTHHDITFGDTDTVLPPFFTEYEGRTPSGKIGKQPGFCSDKWKREPIQKYLNDRYGEKELTARGVDFWIGMSFEESRRVKYPSGKWQKRYPLFEAEILRSQAIKIVQDYGLPQPPRSACWMCPNRHNDEWQWMKDNVPQDFEKAVIFEKKLQEDYEWLWLHEQGRHIDKIDFVELSRSDKQIDIFDKFCDTGMCFV
jgi:hypothetical protein